MSQTQGRVSINPFPTVYNSGIELRGGGGGLRTATAHFKVQVKTSLELTVI